LARSDAIDIRSIGSAQVEYLDSNFLIDTDRLGRYVADHHGTASEFEHGCDNLLENIQFGGDG